MAATTQEQAIKVGFLLRCAELGLTMDETRQRVKAALAQFKQQKPREAFVKQAADPLTLAWLLGGLGSLASGGMKLTGDVIKTIPGLTSIGGALALGAPIALGGAGGYLAAKMTEPNSRNMLEEAKQDEVVDEYVRLAEEAKRRATLKRIQAQTGQRIVPLSPSLGV